MIPCWLQINSFTLNFPQFTMNPPASCPLVRPWESIVIGAVGGFVTIGTDILLDKLKIDDPVSAVAVHGASGTWVSVWC